MESIIAESLSTCKSDAKLFQKVISMELLFVRRMVGRENPSLAFFLEQLRMNLHFNALACEIVVRNIKY